jgi:hypothetical protein
MYDKYRLTDEQIKACKKVFKAMKDADKLGVQFWDMYGTLTQGEFRIKVANVHDTNVLNIPKTNNQKPKP